jgi:hypothetical protein
LRVAVEATFIARYDVRQAGNRTHLEYWIPEEELEALNDAMVGRIETIAKYLSK